jgi:hypothetical protein
MASWTGGFDQARAMWYHRRARSCQRLGGGGPGYDEPRADGGGGQADHDEGDQRCRPSRMLSVTYWGGAHLLGPFEFQVPLGGYLHRALSSFDPGENEVISAHIFNPVVSAVVCRGGSPSFGARPAVIGERAAAGHDFWPGPEVMPSVPALHVGAGVRAGRRPGRRGRMSRRRRSRRCCRGRDRRSTAEQHTREGEGSYGLDYA